MNEALLLLQMGGVVGGGGAGFPTAKKLETPVETLLINGAECEPLLKSDQFLMEHAAADLVEGARLLGKLVGAARVAIALKAHYKKALAALTSAIEGREVELVLLPTVYPVGDEQVVVFAATGRVVAPLALPASVGATVVSVSTTINARHALHGQPVTRRLVTVAGEVVHPGLYDVPVGTSIAALAAFAGARPRTRLMLGGPMMGALVCEDDEPVVTKTCGGLLVLPEHHLLVTRGELPIAHMQRRAKAACIQCRMCTDLCPRYLLGQPLAPHKVMRAFAGGGEPDPSALLCVECGICEAYACPMGMSPRRIQALLKPVLRAKGVLPDRSLYPGQSGMQPYRQVPSDRLLARLGVAGYDMPVPEHAILFDPAQVRVPLKQHIGVPCSPCVQVGEAVLCGQMIGLVPEGALGAALHASIDGVITAVHEDIVIEGRRGA